MNKVLLGDVAEEVRDNYKEMDGNPAVVGLEHLIPGEIRLKEWSEDTNTTFTKAFHKGQVLFGRRRAYLKKAAVAPVDGICSGDITVISAKQDKILPELLPFVIQNDDFFDFAVGKSAGSLSPRVKWSRLKEYEFNLPGLSQQRKLAKLLWSFVDAKEAYEDLIRQTDELVKSQFIEMFGDTDNRASLESLCTVFADGDWIESKDQSDEGIRLIQTGNIGNAEYIDKEERARFISDETFDRLSCTEVFPGDVLISRLPDPIARCCIVPDIGRRAITAVDCTIVRFKTEILPDYFEEYTLTPDYALQIKDFVTGSTRQRISRKNLGAVTVPVPDLERQKVFVEIAHQSDKSKFELNEAIKDLDAMYKRIIKDNLG
jgi:type I restriction enzyme S subunit